MFYSWGEVKYFPIMILSTVVDFFCSQVIEKHRDSSKIKKASLAVSVVFNLGMLLTFKYADFFISNINSAFGTAIPLLKLKLPLGISFYTFQTMSYTIDVYRGNTISIRKKLKEFGATFNPRLNGGPGWIIPNNKESSFRHTFAMYI